MNGRFVLHRHDTEVPHLDLGLELDGALGCWRLDDAPSFDPADVTEATRLADRPLDYVRFGGIALGLDCGPGALDVWDEGFVHVLDRDEGGRRVAITAAVDAGGGRIWLEGSILQGGWDLTRAGERWHLRKASDLVSRGALALGITRSVDRRAAGRTLVSRRP